MGMRPIAAKECYRSPQQRGGVATRVRSVGGTVCPPHRFPMGLRRTTTKRRGVHERADEMTDSCEWPLGPEVNLSVCIKVHLSVYFCGEERGSKIATKEPTCISGLSRRLRQGSMRCFVINTRLRDVLVGAHPMSVGCDEGLEQRNQTGWLIDGVRCRLVGVDDRSRRDCDESWVDLVETLPDSDRRAVMAAIANSVLEGWQPKRRSVE